VKTLLNTTWVSVLILFPHVSPNLPRVYLGWDTPNGRGIKKFVLVRNPGIGLLWVNSSRTQIIITGFKPVRMAA